MPNWCYTYITINHEDEKKLVELHNKIEQWCSKDYKENGFGKTWLGNVVGNSSIGTIDTGADTDLKCRGMIEYMEVVGGQLLINVETAWVPMLKMWTKILDKYLPDAELIYNAEEPGMSIYCTNDPCLCGNYYIDIMGDIDIEGVYDADEKYVVRLLQKLLNTNIDDIDALINMLGESDYNNDIYINEWEYVDIDEWN